MVGTMGIAGNYEVYANGVRLGGSGKMKERLLPSSSHCPPMPFPTIWLGSEAILFWPSACAVNWGSSTGRGASTPLSSESVYLLGRESAQPLASYVAAHQGGPELMLSILALLAGVISFALYFGAANPARVSGQSVSICSPTVVMEVLQLWLNAVRYSFPAHVLDFVLVSVLTITLIEFVRLVLHMPRTRWLLALEVVCSLVFPVDSASHRGNHFEHAQFGVFYTCPGDEDRSAGDANQGPDQG